MIKQGRSKINPYPVLGALIGLIVSLLLLALQDVEALFYLTAAPYYLDVITVNSGHLVSVITFIYFICIFSLLGYIFTKKISKTQLIVVFLVMLLAHITLAKLGSRDIFNGLWEALKAYGTK